MRERHSAEVVEAAIGAHGEVEISFESAENPLVQENIDNAELEPGVARSSSSRTNKLPATNEHELQAQVKEEKSRQPRNKPERSVMARTVLTKELEALELLIQLQERKLALLGSIRATAIEDEDAPANANTLFSATSSRLTDAQLLEDAIERRLEVLAAGAVQDLMSPIVARELAFDTLFVATAELPVRQRVVDMKMMKLQPSSHQELLVAALEDGSIEFYLSPRVLLLRIEATTERRTIHSLELDLHGEVPSLVVVHSQPQVAVVYALELAENGYHLIGASDSKAPSSRTANATTSFSSDPGSQHVLTATEISTMSLPSDPTALALAKSARRSVISIADADGALRFFAHNGTLLHSIATNSSITAMATQRGRVAFSNGSDTLLLPLARGRDSACIVCPGSAANVTSISFDPEHSDLLYAGTSLGEVLVYAIKENAAPLQSSGKGVCTLVSRALVKGTISSHPVSTTLRSAKGFLVASSDSTVAVHNVSRSHDGVVKIGTVCTTSIALRSRTASSKDDCSSSTEEPVLLAVSDGAFVTNIAFVVSTAAPDSEIRVFQSLLPTRAETTEASWIGMTYIGAIVIAVLAIQFSLRRQQRPSQGDPWSVKSSRRNHRRSAVGSHSPSSASGFGFRGQERSEQFSPHAAHGYEHLPQEINAAVASRSTRDLRGSRAFVSAGKSRGGPLTDRERFGPSYDLLSDDLKRKIAEARRETLECAFDSSGEDDSF